VEQTTRELSNWPHQAERIGELLYLGGHSACASNSQIRAIAFVYSFARNRDADVHCGAAYKLLLL
jgi:hypothetical protein